MEKFNGISKTISTRIEQIAKLCSTINPVVVVRCITFNHGQYINNALDGFIMQQTSFPVVVIVHDDASTDETPSILKEYAERYPDIIFPIIETENLYSKHDGAIGRIINAACDATGAKYIAMCEGDDYWTDPYKLQKQVDFLESHPEYGMCYTKIRRFDNRNNTFTQIWGGPNETLEELLLKNTVPTLTAIFLRTIYDRFLSEVKPSEKGWKMGDYPVWLYMAKNSKIKFINEVTGVYRVLEESASHSNDIEKIIQFNNSYHDIRTWYNRCHNVIPQEKLEQNQAVLLFNSAVFRNSKKYAKIYYNKIEQKNIHIILKYWICMIGLYPRYLHTIYVWYRFKRYARKFS